MKISELLGSPDKWCQGSGAQKEDGAIVDSLSQNATKWCIYGALWKCYRDSEERYEALMKLNEALKMVFGDSHLVWWNDYRYRTFEDVRQLVLEAGV